MGCITFMAKEGRNPDTAGSFTGYEKEGTGVGCIG